MSNEILGMLRVLFTPSVWHQLHDYSPAWDRHLSTALSCYKFRERDRYVSYLGPYTIWVKNHPYASFRPYYDFKPDFVIRAKRITILRAHDKWMKEIRAGQLETNYWNSQP